MALTEEQKTGRFGNAGLTGMDLGARVFYGKLKKVFEISVIG